MMAAIFVKSLTMMISIDTRERARSDLHCKLRQLRGVHCGVAGWNCEKRMALGRAMRFTCQRVSKAKRAHGFPCRGGRRGHGAKRGLCPPYILARPTRCASKAHTKCQ